MKTKKTELFSMALFLLLFLNGICLYAEDEVRHNPWSLIIYRPENSWQINETRCYLKLEDAETGEDVTYTKSKANYSWGFRAVSKRRSDLCRRIRSDNHGRRHGAGGKTS